MRWRAEEVALDVMTTQEAVDFLKKSRSCGRKRGQTFG
jgi:hypothetical protein